MSQDITQIRRELESLGFTTSLLESPLGEVIAFQYLVVTGSLKGKNVRMGISMQGRELYPEYPPHWIHVTPPIDDGMGGNIVKYIDSREREWCALSRPPGEIWDQLPTKHMYAYLNEHLRRFWDNL